MTVTPARARLFFIAWAVAIGAHLWNHSIPESLPPPTVIDGLGMLTLISAFVTVWRPIPATVLTTACLQLAHLGAEMPMSPDHWILAGFGNLVLTVESLRLIARRQRLSLVGLLDRAAPTLRTLLVLCYGAAAIAKLNWDFVNPEFSCAVHLSRQMAAQVPMGPDTPVMHSLFMWGTIVAELVVGFLLVPKATRRVALTIGIGFHLLISFTPAVSVFDFTALLMAFWVLFAPDGTEDRLAVVRAKLAVRYKEVVPYLPAALTAVWAALCVLAVARPWRTVGFKILAFDAWGVLFLTLGVWAIWTAPRPQRLRFAPTLVAAPIVLIAALNVAGPYIGLKSVSSFTMYSNLQTERHSNHWFLPSVPLLPNLRDLVVIRSSNDEDINGLVGRIAVPRMLLARHLRERTEPVELAYSLRGEEYTTDDARVDARITHMSWWEDKLLIFRTVPEEIGPITCQN